MLLGFSTQFNEVIAKLNNSESLDSSLSITISTRPIDMEVLVESIKDTKHKVKALTINSIKLTGDEIKKLEDIFTYCTSLESLNLSDNDLTSEEAEILAGILANNKTIKSLSLNNNKIGDNGLNAFAKIAENSPIENLNFNENHISDKGFEVWLAAHKKNNNLIEFNFDNNIIHDKGLQALAEFLPSVTKNFTFTMGLEGRMSPKIRNLLDKEIKAKKSNESINIKTCINRSEISSSDKKLDIWVEDRIPESKPQQPPKEVSEAEQLVKAIPVSNLIPALQLKPTEQLVDKAPSVASKAGEQVKEGGIGKILQSSSSETISNYKEEGSVMKLESNENKPKEEIIVENKFNPEATLELLDEYNSNFYPLLEKNNQILEKRGIKLNLTEEKDYKALIILGNPGSGKTTLTKLFASKTLTINVNEEGTLILPHNSLPSSSPLGYSLPGKPIINIAKSVDDVIVCENNSLQDKLSKSEAIINTFYMKKILSNYSTKFIITIKDSDLKKEFLPITKKLAILLENVTLTRYSLYLVVTDTPPYKTTTNISTSLTDIVEWRARGEEKYREKQEEIIKFLKLSTSLCLFPTFYPGTINLGNFDHIFGKKFPPLTKENNKIAAGSTNISDILTLQSSIKEGLREGISKLSDKIKTKWDKEKDSLFTLESKSIYHDTILLPDTTNLKILIDIFKKLSNPSNNDTTTDNDGTKFLALNNALYEVLGDKESNGLNNKLSNYVDYLKYFTEISSTNRENISISKMISPRMRDNWFKMLADGVLSIGDVNEQLIESFKTAMQTSFYSNLKISVENFSDSIKNIKILTEDTLNNIYNLKMLQSILTNNDIMSLTTIESLLLDMLDITSPTNDVLSGLLRQTVKNNIKILKELVIESDLKIKILTEKIWQEFVDLKSIKEINENIHNIIYEKLLTVEIPHKMDIEFYDKLLTSILLEDVENASLSSSHIKAYHSKLAEIYCQMGNVTSDSQTKKEYYEKAIENNKSNKEAHEELGDIELQDKNYKKAMEHYQYTNCISKEKAAFKAALGVEEKKKTHNDYNIQDQVELHLKHGKYLADKGFTEKGGMVVLDAQPLAKENYSLCVKIYENLALISKEIALKHIHESTEYSSKAAVFSSAASTTWSTEIIDNYKASEVMGNTIFNQD
ncbi:hypothetical protein [Rickettsia endosymbiont of Aspidapion aeneum]|uniref:hypothetical protein n=1 Tax=Rickettsia endosymbiont of Aspidapion aeneum TaxID=3066247 RepID=UPI00313E6018